MSIETELTDLATNLENIKSAIVDKGGSVAEGAGFSDIATAVDDIPAGGGGIDPLSSDYGVIYYYSKWEKGYKAIDNNTGSFAFYFDSVKFGKFLSDNNIPDSWSGMTTVEVLTTSSGGHYAQFHYMDMDSMAEARVYFDSLAEVENTLGFTLPSGTSPNNWYYHISVELVVDENSEIVPVVLSDLNDYNKLSNSADIFEIDGKEVYKNAVVTFYGGTTPTSIPNNFLRRFEGLKRVVLTSGITTIGNSFCANCIKLNEQITVPEGVVSIGSYFLSSCSSFNSAVYLPSSLRTIGNDFMSHLKVFNQPIALPQGLTQIGQTAGNSAGFFNNCYAMVSPINVGSLNPNIVTVASKGAESTLSAYSSSVPSYTTGITIKGANRQAWLTKYPNSSGSLVYRKLLDGGE